MTVNTVDVAKVEEALVLFGGVVTALVSGTRNRLDVDRWASGETQPAAEQLEKIELAVDLIKQVAATEGCDFDAYVTARQWILGPSAIVNDREISPAMAIRDGHLDAARAAAQRMTEGAEHVVVREASALCGIRLAAVLANTTRAADIEDWISGVHRPTGTQLERFAQMLRITKPILNLYDVITVRQWLRSSSPYLGDASPILTIRDGNFTSAEEAAKSFLE